MTKTISKQMYEKQLLEEHDYDCEEYAEGSDFFEKANSYKEIARVIDTYSGGFSNISKITYNEEEDIYYCISEEYRAERAMKNASEMKYILAVGMLADTMLEIRDGRTEPNSASTVSIFDDRLRADVSKDIKRQAELYKPHNKNNHERD